MPLVQDWVVAPQTASHSAVWKLPSSQIEDILSGYHQSMLTAMTVCMSKFWLVILACTMQMGQFVLVHREKHEEI